MRAELRFLAVLLLCSLSMPRAVEAAERRREAGSNPQISAQPPEVLRATIESLEQLRVDLEKKNKKVSPLNNNLQRQVSITLQQASLLMSLGQALLVGGKEKKERTEGESVLDRCIALLDGLIQNPTIVRQLSAQQRGALFRLRGASHFYKNKYDSALGDFEKSLESDLKSPDAIWTAFMAAEEHFERGNFKRASELYAFVRARSAQDSKPAELSQYKLTWCLINLDQLDMAEASFLELVTKAQDEQLGVDAARDLAFIASRTKKEAQILDLFETKLLSTGDRGRAFLKKALSTFESQGKVGSKSPLRERVLALEKDPEARVKVHLESIQNVAKEYASLPHAELILDVLAAINQIPEEKREPLEASGERICKTFSEAYAGRTQSPEKIDKERLGKTLRELLLRQLEAFPKGKRKPQLYGILLDVCELERDSQCLVSVSRKMKADPALTDAARNTNLQRAKEAEILGLEGLSAGPQGDTYRDEFKKALALRLAEPGAPNAALAGAKLAQLEIADQNFESAKKTLTAVLKLKATHEHWYSFKWIQLKTGDLEGVLQGPEAQGISQIGGSPDPRLNAVLAEASVKLAAKARAEGNLKQMAGHIQRFESLSKDPEKVNLARDEWVRSLLDHKLFMEAARKIYELPEDWHSREAADEFKLTLVSEAVDSSKLEWLGDWFFKWRALTQPRADFGSVLLARLYLGGPQAISADQIRALTEPQKNVWLSAAVLSEPSWVYRYFQRIPPRSPVEQSMNALAHRFLGKAPPRSAGSLRTQSAPLTEFELSAARVSFPDPVTKSNQKTLDAYTKKLQAATQSVTALREKMLPTLRGQEAEVQFRILKAQRTLEQRTARAIVMSPLPGGLNAAQTKQYREGLKALALEYQNQVTELDATQAKIQARVAEIKKQADEEEKLKVLPPLKSPDILIGGVSRNPEGPTGQLFKLTSKSNTWGALMELERLRAKKLISDELYWRLRAWSLASRGQDPTLLKYLLDELTDSNQQALIDEWKKGASTP